LSLIHGNSILEPNCNQKSSFWTLVMEVLCYNLLLPQVVYKEDEKLEIPTQQHLLIRHVF